MRPRTIIHVCSELLLSSSAWKMTHCTHQIHLKEVPIPGPDFVKLAHAYGMPAQRVTHQEDVMPALRQAQAYDGPYLVEFVVDPSVNLYPMVPPGGSLGDTMEDPLTAAAHP